MKGEALKKRYEVKDLETGEVLDEPLYVLRPTQDEFASTVMYAYARLCGITEDERKQAIADPPPDPPTERWRELVDAAVEEDFDPADWSDSMSKSHFYELANVGEGHGTMLDAYMTLNQMDMELVSAVVARRSDERTEKLHERASRARGALALLEDDLRFERMKQEARAPVGD